jgi:peptide-methionine (S)-S-oxide reductase
MAAIFYHNDEQKELALKTLDEVQARSKGKITTQIIPFGRFYLAEDYHQKYSLRRDRELMNQFSAMYPDLKGFVDSTAAARLNGYLGGNGTAESLEAELTSLGLSQESATKLLEAVKNRHKGFRLF